MSVSQRAIAAPSYGEGNLATAARRLAAAVIDWALVTALLYVYFTVVADSDFFTDEMSVLVFIGVISLLYYAGLTWLLGATPGKALVGIEVVRPDGSWPGVGRSLLRFAVWALLPVISWALVLGKHHQGIHDQIADTYVVRQR